MDRMKFEVSGIDLQGKSISLSLRGVPDICPICHISVHPKTVTTVFLSELGMAQTVFRCTHQKCQELFIGTYKEESNYGLTLDKVSPKNPIEKSFPENIKECSPTFIEIFNQALAAEADNLTQLVGIGLRKALEFLIKDYAVKNNKEDEENIRRIFLGKCINTYIDDSNIKECAKRAVWLGNDETHYTRKWDDRDINDLKILVMLTVNWIDNVMLTETYISEMED
jgi:hypothetical protein